jgi:hypothetical protein
VTGCTFGTCLGNETAPSIVLYATPWFLSIHYSIGGTTQTPCLDALVPNPPQSRFVGMDQGGTEFHFRLNPL